MAKAKTKQKAERRLSTPSATSGEDGRTETRQIPPYDLIPTKDNPRGSINQRSADFKRLVQSVKAVGVKVHVHARPHPDHPDKWDLRDGARRVAAAKLAKLPVVPVIVHLDMIMSQCLVAHIPTHARISRTTWPPTSVNRKSRPRWR